MIRILTLCTGNVCRSPLCAQLLAARLDPTIFEVDSAGISPLAGDHMPREMQRIVARMQLGQPSEHRARAITKDALANSDLIFGMSRHHRSAAVLHHPPVVRKAFTLLEFAHVVSQLEPQAISTAAEPQPDSRLAVLDTVMRMRGVVPRLSTGALYDVEDPYGRSIQAFERSAKQIETAVELIAEFFDRVFATHLTIRNERYQRS